jgi:hypothetical protein
LLYHHRVIDAVPEGRRDRGVVRIEPVARNVRPMIVGDAKRQLVSEERRVLRIAPADVEAKQEF